MRTETIWALKKIFENKAKEEILSEGIYDVKDVVILDVRGVVTREADYERTPTVSIPLKTALILCLDKLDFFKRGNFKKILLECMQEALSEEEDPSPLIKERINEIDKAEKHLKETLGKLPKQPCSGRTIVDAIMEEVSGPVRIAMLATRDEVHPTALIKKRVRATSKKPARAK